MQRLFIQCLTLCLGIACMQAAFALPQNMENFITYMHKQHGFSEQYLTEVLAQQKPDQNILTIEHRPYEHKTWPEFHKGLITQNRIKQGVIFFNQHKEVLLQAQKKYHVDPYVITAIIGFESTYGKNAGHHQALNSLYTLGFYYPPREKYFQKQLENLFLLAREWHRPVQSIQSSFDGGLGMPQFMPDMYRKVAIAYHNDQFPDLIHNTNDAIFSVASYLHRAHWQTKSFIAEPMQVRAQVLEPHCHYQHKPTYNMQELRQDGFVIAHKLPQNKVGCISLEDEETTDYWAIGDNFYAIQKYNPQIYYVLIVNDLSKAIQKSTKDKI